MLKDLIKKDVDIDEVSAQIVVNMPISQRRQLFYYLVGIAQADRHPSQAELDVLRKISVSLRLPGPDVESIFSIFGNSLDDAYKVLEIDSSVDDNELKKAYRRMVVKYHPDKVATLGEDVKRAAEEKFKAVQEAYDKIKKERKIH